MSNGVEERTDQSRPATLLPNLSDATRLQDIKANQRWLEGSAEVQIIRVFGIRILMQRNTSNDEEEIAEPDFRKRFTFVAER